MYAATASNLTTIERPLEHVGLGLKLRGLAQKLARAHAASGQVAQVHRASPQRCDLVAHHVVGALDWRRERARREEACGLTFERGLAGALRHAAGRRENRVVNRRMHRYSPLFPEDSRQI